MANAPFYHQHFILPALILNSVALFCLHWTAINFCIVQSCHLSYKSLIPSLKYWFTFHASDSNLPQIYWISSVANIIFLTPYIRKCHTCSKEQFDSTFQYVIICTRLNLFIMTLANIITVDHRDWHSCLWESVRSYDQLFNRLMSCE